MTTFPQTVDETRVSFSSLTRHRKCPQAWIYDSVRRLESEPSEGGSIRRDFGSWWHAVRAADSIRRGRQHGSLRYCPEWLTTGDDGPRISTEDPEFSSSVVHLVARSWWERQSDTFRAAWVEEMGQALPEHLLAMDHRWLSQWADETEHEHPIGVEVQWSRDIPLPNGGSFRLDGAVDEIYLDTRKSLAVVRDHKTNTTIPAAEALDDLLDSQTHLYAWGAALLLKEWEVAANGLALSYDRARSAPPKEPALTKSGTLSKSVKDYDLATYLEFTEKPVPYPGLKKDGSGAGEYVRDEKVVEDLSTPAARAKWNDRTLTPVNMNIVRAHLRSARDTRVDMERTLEGFLLSGEAPRNLTRMGCRFCDFAELCLGEMRAGGAQSEDIDPADYGLRVKPD